MATDNNIPDKQFDEIERFLHHQMSAGEDREFRQRLETNPALQEQVQEMQLIILGIEESQLQNKLDQFHKDIPAAKVKQLFPRRWLIAASALICLSAAAWWLLRSPSNERLFADHFRPDPGLISSMGSSDNYDFERSMVDYKNGQYQQAIKAWKALLGSNTSSDTLNYFIGSAYLALKQGDSATAYFRKVIAGNESIFKDETNWYLGLSLILENKIPEAIPYIEQSSHKEKETLLSKLKQ